MAQVRMEHSYQQRWHYNSAVNSLAGLQLSICLLGPRVELDDFAQKNVNRGSPHIAYLAVLL